MTDRGKLTEERLREEQARCESDRRPYIPVNAEEYSYLVRVALAAMEVIEACHRPGAEPRLGAALDALAAELGHD